MYIGAGWVKAEENVQVEIIFGDTAEKGQITVSAEGKDKVLVLATCH